MSKLQERQQPPQSARPVVLVGPSAVGKGTLTKMLFEKYPGVFGKKISTTTRAPRVGEVHGKDYYFVTLEEFIHDEAAGLFIETADIHGKKYGTSFAAVHQASTNNRIPLLELDVQGVCSVKRLSLDKVNETLGNDQIDQADCSALKSPVMETTMIWINPPTPESLLDRLQARGTETPEQIGKRMTTAKFELAFFKKYFKIFDKVLVNDDLQRSFKELEQYLYLNYPSQFHTPTLSITSTTPLPDPSQHDKIATTSNVSITPVAAI